MGLIFYYQPQTILAGSVRSKCGIGLHQSYFWADITVYGSEEELSWQTS
jgi:hypothetical protein